MMWLIGNVLKVCILSLTYSIDKKKHEFDDNKSVLPVMVFLKEGLELCCVYLFLFELTSILHSAVLYSFMTNSSP